MKKYELIKNEAGRLVPDIVNGKKQIPFKGVDKHKPLGRKASPPIFCSADYPKDGNKVLKGLKEAFEFCGIKDEMTVSTHHHFRNGDFVANMMFEVFEEMKLKDIMWFPSASFPCHIKAIDLMDKGIIHHIEGSLNGPLGDYCTQGKMRGMGVLRSHGGRWQAIQDGEVHIDIAVIAAPAADPFGNANGVLGKTACGSLNFALADSLYADRVIVVTDNLVEFPCIPWQIQGNNVDAVVVVDKIGDPSKIVSGTTEITRSPDRLLIAQYVADFLEESGIMQDGFSFQAGASGIALAFVLFLKEKMKKRGIKARFVRGGSTKYLVELLNEGLTDYILDGQTFDLYGVESMRDNPKHIATSPFTSYNYNGKGFFATFLDAVILGATEVDVNFNANVVTHSDGRLLHGIGGWQNCLFSRCTILALPSMRDRIPVIVDEVTTLTGPSELIDVVITERGICINPKRVDLIERTKSSKLPIRDIRDLQKEVYEICGGRPNPPKKGKEVVAVVKWVDGTLLDSIWKIE